MPPTLQELGIDRLTAEDRLRLIEAIWDSLSLRGQLAIPDSHLEELDRRLLAADAEPTAASSWEEVRKRLRGGA